MTDATTLALVGATGGAGTTRVTVELAALLARDGRDVAVLDAAYATQGLAQYVEGRIDPDATAVALGEGTLREGLVDLPTARGRVACLPASAPFERLARAKAPEAARTLEDVVAEAAGEFDRVLVDTPPVAANQAVAAVNAADRLAVVASGTPRGRDAVPRMRDRLLDVEAGTGATVATRTEAADWADAAVPEDGTPPGDAPVADERTDPFTEGIAAVAAATLDVSPDVEFEAGLRDYVP